MGTERAEAGRELCHAGTSAPIADTKGKAHWTAERSCEHPFSGETGYGLAYWARAGVLINHIEIEDQEGDLIADTRHGLGWEVGAGVALGVGERGSFTPGVRFRSLSRDLEFDGGEVPVDLRYVIAELGFAWSF